MPPQSSPNPDYNFFLNPPPAPKPSMLSGASTKQRIILVVGGILILIILGYVASLLLTSKTNTTGLIPLAQQQNEIIRVSIEASAGDTNQATKNLAVNLQLALATNQQQLLAYLLKTGQKVPNKTLGLTKSKATDQQLATALAASDYDVIYVQIMQSSLTKYSQNLQQVYAATTNTTQRNLLSTDYKAVTLLISQANSTALTLQSS